MSLHALLPLPLKALSQRVRVENRSAMDAVV